MSRILHCRSLRRCGFRSAAPRRWRSWCRPTLPGIIAMSTATAMAMAIVIPKVTAAQPVDPLWTAVDELIAEAREAMAREAMPSGEADYASRTEASLDPNSLAKAILSPQHEHPVIDAYVRWQLTSFDVALPELALADFFHVLNKLPALIENPRAEPSLLEVTERAAEAGRLSPFDLQQLREVLRVVEKTERSAEAFNRPALELREWISDRLPRGGPMRLLMLLEQCAATVEAGWSTRAIKSRISRTFSSASTNPSLSEADRRTVLAELPRLTSVHRRFVNTVTFLNDGSVRVRFSTAAITDRDVENWTKRLLGSSSP